MIHVDERTTVGMVLVDTIFGDGPGVLVCKARGSRYLFDFSVYYIKEHLPDTNRRKLLASFMDINHAILFAEVFLENDTQSGD